MKIRPVAVECIVLAYVKPIKRFNR